MEDGNNYHNTRGVALSRPFGIQVCNACFVCAVHHYLSDDVESRCIVGDWAIFGGSDPLAGNDLARVDVATRSNADSECGHCCGLNSQVDSCKKM